MSVAAVILAAGRGTRFGEQPKLLADFRGKPLVRHVTEAALNSTARPVILVTGNRSRDVLKAVADLPVRPVLNSRFAEGLSTSLQTGFRSLPSDAEAAVVLLADMPRIGAPLIDRLIESWGQAGRPAALIPTFGGQRGNPVVLSASLISVIEALTGDAGAGPILRTRNDVVVQEVDDPAVVQDVDTAEALAALHN
jgi:molybdenum cofactor cytidylyltransferase